MPTPSQYRDTISIAPEFMNNPRSEEGPCGQCDDIRRLKLRRDFYGEERA